MNNFLIKIKKTHFRPVLNTKHHQFISQLNHQKKSIIITADKESEKSIEIRYPVNIGTRFNMLLSEESFKKAITYIYSNDD